jgi:hypothetical protein
MAAITNPQAIKFSDEKLRVAADLLAQLDNFAGTVLNEWTALGGTALIPNTADVLADSAAPNGLDATGGDGRPVITGAKLNNIINRLTGLRSATATTGLAMGVAGVRDTVLQVAVNTVKS